MCVRDERKGESDKAWEGARGLADITQKTNTVIIFFFHPRINGPISCDDAAH